MEAQSNNPADNTGADAAPEVKSLQDENAVAPDKADAPLKPNIQVNNTLDVKNAADNTNQRNEMIVNMYSFEKQEIEIGYLKRPNNAFEIKTIDQALINKFLQTRLLVIEHDNHELGQIAAENILFESGLQYEGDPLCYTMESSNIETLNQFISLLIKNPKCKSNQPQIIVVYESRTSVASCTDFLNLVVNKGGPAYSISERLKMNELLLIYVASNQQIQTLRLDQTVYFAFLHLSTYQVFLQKLGWEPEKSVKFAAWITETVKTTGWLSDLTDDEKETEIRRLAAQNELEFKLRELNQSIDLIGEKNKISGLLGEPLNNIILFTAAFFEQTNLTDYDYIVTLLIQRQHADYELIVNGVRCGSLQSVWDAEQMVISHSCGIILKTSKNGNFTSFGFEKSISEDICKEMLSRRFKLALIKRMDILTENCLLAPDPLAPGIEDGIINLCFLNAETDPDQSLKQICIRLSDSFINMVLQDEHPKDSKRVFDRLLKIVKRWNKDPSFGKNIHSYYNLLLQSEGGRTLLAILLTYLAKPEYPEGLLKLKALLDAASFTEFTIGYNTVQSIINSYIISLPELLQEIYSWQEVKEPNKISKSYAITWYAVLKIYFDRWDEDLVIKRQDYMLWAQAVKNGMTENLKKIIAIVFCAGSQRAFDIVRPPDRKNTNEKLRHKAQADNLQLLYGLILVQWYELLVAIKGKDGELVAEDHLLMKEILAQACALQGTPAIAASLMLSVRWYNHSLQTIKDPETEKGKKLRKIIIRKRNEARLLADLISDQNT